MRRAAASRWASTCRRAQGVSGVVRGEFTPNDRRRRADRHRSRRVLAGQPDAADTTLTVRDGPFGQPETIARDRFTLQGQHRHDDRRLHAGPHVRAVVPAREIPGLRARAWRRSATWRPGSSTRPTRWRARRGRLPSVRRRADASCGRSSTTASTPTSRAAQVFDGVMAHIAGGARLSLNAPRRDAERAVDVRGDDVSVRRDCAARSDQRHAAKGCSTTIARAATSRRCSSRTPSVEYWGGGRSAALIHTSAGRQGGPDAAGQRARLLPDRRAARAGAVPDARSTRDSSRTTRSSTRGRCGRCSSR